MGHCLQRRVNANRDDCSDEDDLQPKRKMKVKRQIEDSSDEEEQKEQKEIDVPLDKDCHAIVSTSSRAFHKEKAQKTPPKRVTGCTALFIYLLTIFKYWPCLM